MINRKKIELNRTKSEPESINSACECVTWLSIWHHRRRRRCSGRFYCCCCWTRRVPKNQQAYAGCFRRGHCWCFQAFEQRVRWGVDRQSDRRRLTRGRRRQCREAASRTRTTRRVFDSDTGLWVAKADACTSVARVGRVESQWMDLEAACRLWRPRTCTAWIEDRCLWVEIDLSTWSRRLLARFLSTQRAMTLLFFFCCWRIRKHLLEVI